MTMNPIRQRPRMHPELPSDIHNRTRPINHPTNSLLLELRRVLLTTHDHPFDQATLPTLSGNLRALQTAYANNLMRSPVEYAQAALSLHALSGGRFQVGLGAGWAKGEIIASGLKYPTSRERAERFREAVIIVRQLLRGPCRHDGDH